MSVELLLSNIDDPAWLRDRPHHELCDDLHELADHYRRDVLKVHPAVPPPEETPTLWRLVYNVVETYQFARRVDSDFLAQSIWHSHNSDVNQYGTEAGLRVKIRETIHQLVCSDVLSYTPEGLVIVNEL